nr:MAG TPA: hypothetical protein [Caudoviricetes sp.]
MLKEKIELHTGQKVEEKNKVFGGKYKILEKGKIKGTDMFINYRRIESDIEHDNNLPKAY